MKRKPKLVYHSSQDLVDVNTSFIFKVKDEFECFRISVEYMVYDGNIDYHAVMPTLEEAAEVIELLEKNGLKRGENGLRVIMMCELPSNALLAEEFLEYFDGFSIGSNDLTQLTLGLDRDSAIIAHLFDERNPAIKKLLSMAIQACRRADKYIGICGQGPSDHPDLAKWLMEEGIDSVSLNPDSVLETWLFLAGQESK
jgi:pyruvate,water dikinase